MKRVYLDDHLKKLLENIFLLKFIILAFSKDTKIVLEMLLELDEKVVLDTESSFRFGLLFYSLRAQFFFLLYLQAQTFNNRTESRSRFCNQRPREGTAVAMEIETQQRAWEGGRLVQSASESSRKLDYEAEARLVAEARAAWERRAKGEVEDDDEDDPEMLLDYHAYQA
jgi:hypothetical protein